MRTRLTSLVVALGVGAATAASAQSFGYNPAPQEVVRYQELDLVGPAGVAALQARIAGAARRVCGPEPSLMELRLHRIYAECVRTARASAGETVATAVAKARADATMVARK